MDPDPAPVAEHHELVAAEGVPCVALGGVALVCEPGVVRVLVLEVLAYRGRGFAAGGHLRSPR